jgi:hypothetical protein
MSQTLTESLRDIATKLGAWPDIPRAAYTDPREELIYRYAIGTGVFVNVGGIEYIEITTSLFKLDGEPDGSYKGVDQPIVPIESLFQRPDPPAPPFDQPVPPVPHTPIQSWSKGVWTFADGSSVGSGIVTAYCHKKGRQVVPVEGSPSALKPQKSSPFGSEVEV